MGTMIPIKDWDVLCVLRDVNNHGFEVAVDKRSGSIKLTSHGGFSVELSPARAMWAANTLIKYCPMFARKAIPEKLYEIIGKIK